MIVKNGLNGWILFATNTYTGQTIVNAGTLGASGPDGLGVGDNTIANGTIVNSGASLFVAPLSPDAKTFAPEYIRIFGTGASCCSGALATGGGTSPTLTGTVELASADARIYIETVELTLTGLLTGSGSLTTNGDSRLTLTNPANDFTGRLVNISGSSFVLSLTASHALPPGKDVQNGNLLLNGTTQSIASLALGRSVGLGGGQLTITGPGATTYGGNIATTGTVIQTGGQLTLTAANTFTGAWNNNGGELRLVAGSIVAPFTQTAGAFGIASNGHAGLVTIGGGTFAPGRGGTGVGNSGNLTLTPAATYAETINGSGAGAFGLVHVTGAVDLGARRSR